MLVSLDVVFDEKSSYYPSSQSVDKSSHNIDPCWSIIDIGLVMVNKIPMITNQEQTREVPRPETENFHPLDLGTEEIPRHEIIKVYTRRNNVTQGLDHYLALQMTCP